MDYPFAVRVNDLATPAVDPAEILVPGGGGYRVVSRISFERIIAENPDLFPEHKPITGNFCFAMLNETASVCAARCNKANEKTGLHLDWDFRGYANGRAVFTIPVNESRLWAKALTALAEDGPVSVLNGLFNSNRPYFTIPKGTVVNSWQDLERAFILNGGVKIIVSQESLYGREGLIQSFTKTFQEEVRDRLDMYFRQKEKKREGPTEMNMSDWNNNRLNSFVIPGIDPPCVIVRDRTDTGWYRVVSRFSRERIIGDNPTRFMLHEDFPFYFSFVMICDDTAEACLSRRRKAFKKTGVHLDWDADGYINGRVIVTIPMIEARHWAKALTALAEDGPVSVLNGLFNSDRPYFTIPKGTVVNSWQDLERAFLSNGGLEIIRTVKDDRDRELFIESFSDVYQEEIREHLRENEPV